uniref:DNA polymerase II subunit 2 n=1 Tax=Globisporangium ultimum (strain ATCC 200006 / CBS 805.95 / DAOM BR144) TaxID=431595 RepID=K3WKM4_GLOUD
MMQQMLRRRTAVACADRGRSLSILGTIFGIGEFEGARDQSLRATTSKLQAYDLALLEYVGMNSHPKHMLRKVLEDDENFLMGHVLVGASQCLSPLMHQDSLDAAAQASTAATLAQTNESTTVVEKLHVLALDAMVNGRYREATVIYETILLQDHRDLLALRCSFDLYLLLGHLLSMQAYGLQVDGKLDAAEHLTEKAISMNGNDRWAFHTMLHILEARGNANHGASYALQYREMFDNDGPLERHMYFQWALYLLDLGRYDRIEKFLEVNIFQQHTTELRQQLYDAWTSISEDEEEQRVMFSPITKIMYHSILSSFEEDAVPAIQRAPEKSVDLVQLEAKLGVPPIQFSFISSATVEFDAVFNGGEYEAATKLLLPVRGNLRILGGTPTEHEIVDLLLVECASRCEDLTLAKLLLNERLSLRSQSAQVWHTYSRVFESIGDSSALRDAQNMSYLRIFRACKLHGLSLHADALQRLAQELTNEPSLELDDVIYAIKNSIDKSKMTTSVVSLEALESALDTLLAVSSENQFDAIQVFNAFETPKLHYTSHTSSYELKSDAHRRIHAGPEHRINLLRDRFISVDLRVKRNKMFAPPAVAVSNTVEYIELSRIESLLGVTGVKRVIGMLGQDERKRVYLEDLTSRIYIDLKNATYTNGLFTINCVVLVEGEVIDDVLHVHDEPDLCVTSLEVLSGIDPLGVEVSAQQLEQIRELEAGDHHATFIVLSDVHLDDPQVMKHLDVLFQGLEAVMPSLFILMGDFMSSSIGGGVGSNSLQDLKEYFDELANLILKYPRLAEFSKFVLVPGPNDPGSSKAFPRHPVSTCPVSVRKYIVIFRDDLHQKMQRHALLPVLPDQDEDDVIDVDDENDGTRRRSTHVDVSKHLVKTIIDQAHLCPLPLMACPINWAFDSSLQLFPLPDVLILGDATEQFQLGYSSVAVFHPGPFHVDFSFVLYRPSTNATEFSRVE